MFTQDEYDNLKRAYASGTTTVSYGGQTIVYRSLREMRALLDEMEVELGKRPGIRGPLQRYFIGYYDKGL